MNTKKFLNSFWFIGTLCAIALTLATYFVVKDILSDKQVIFDNITFTVNSNEEIMYAEKNIEWKK